MPYHEVLIRIPAEFHEALIQRLTAVATCLGVIEEDDTVIAFFPEAAEMTSIRQELSIIQSLIEKSGQKSAFTFNISIIADQDWNESWKMGFVPIDVGNRFTITPPWEQPKSGRINLVIDPAMAFGTGHHETTRSCLVLMEKYAMTSGKCSFLDLGTGTGILAIAALKLGFHRVIAIDTDPIAVDAARKNAELNQAANIKIRECSISNLVEEYDFIAANIISSVLEQLAPLIAKHVKPGGIVVLSGILGGQDEEVLMAMTQAGLNLTERYPDGKWMSLVLTR
ncbi:MAG TPA: 50S ribosomal protein L11 methyltransferase [Nitrospirota bacterium]|nr:50S ribosomal protein L11 methyltransferase [Nitrospirota bacterium]